MIDAIIVVGLIGLVFIVTIVAGGFVERTSRKSRSDCRFKDAEFRESCTGVLL